MVAFAVEDSRQEIGASDCWLLPLDCAGSSCYSGAAEAEDSVFEEPSNRSSWAFGPAVACWN